MKILILVGLPAVGKTFYGKQIADFLNVEFIDLDDVIEQREQKTISTLVEEHGIQHFRDLEQQCLISILSSTQNDSIVLACGGGTPCYNENLKLLKNAGIVLYLKNDLQIIAQRIIDAKKSIRPLFANLSTIETVKKLNKLNTDRRTIYEQSHIITDVSGGVDFHLLTNRLDLFTESQ